MKIIQRLIVTMMAAAFALIIVTPLQISSAQTNGWSEPIDLSLDNKSSWFPDIAAGADGRIHVIWSSGEARGALARDLIDQLIYRVYQNGAWLPANDVLFTGNGGFAARASLVAGRDSRLHLIVRNETRILYTDADETNAVSARDWSPLRPINHLSGPYYTALTMDNTGALHAFWTDTVPDDLANPRPNCPNCDDLFYRRSTDFGATWSSPINISNTPDGSTKPKARISNDNTIHLVWDEGFGMPSGKGTPTSAIYRRSRDGGLTWEEPVVFTLPPIAVAQPVETPRGALAPRPSATPAPTATPRARTTTQPTGPQPSATPAPTATSRSRVAMQPNAPQQTALGLFQNRSPVVVYRSTVTDDIFYQFSQDGGKTWNRPAPIPGIRARYLNETPFDDYTMETDGSGDVHLVLSGFLSSDPRQPQARPRLLHLVWNGQSWSRPEVVVANDLFPEWPRMAISGDQIHLTWFSRSIDDLYASDRSNYRVWYSRKTLNAAPLVAPPLFTPVPTTAPTSAPTPIPPTPIPTALPAGIAQAPPLDAPPAWEGPGVRIIGMALLPIIGLFAVVLSLRWLLNWRR